MTIDELRLKITSDSNLKGLLDIEININYPHIHFEQKFKGIPALYKFILQQIREWNNKGDLPNTFLRVKDKYINYRDRIDALINKSLSSNNRNWGDLLSELKSNSPPMFLYNCPETTFLLKVSEQFPKSFAKALHFITKGDQSLTLNNRDAFIGYMLAYEFILKDFSEVVQRRNAEKSSISKLRNDFEKYLSESEIEISNFLGNVKNENEEYSGYIDELKESKENEISTWYENWKGKLDKYFLDQEQKMSDLEDLYREKLLLEAPAQYWRNRAKKLKGQAKWWLGGLVLSIGLSVIILFFILNMFQDENNLKFLENTAVAIKWSIIFISLLSLIAYAIRILSRMTFSSFHLARDAEEREQLTYVYLALSEGKEIDDTERHLIMQSLFSRADSGLLKDDGNPTMPGNIVDKFISGKS